MTVKYRARCNKRACQARRTIKGNYDPNDRLPCHMYNCKGLMRKDVTRERLGGNEGRELCHCDGVQWADTRNSPHRKGSEGCRHREEMLIEQALRPVPKHSPRQKPYEPEGEPPF